MLAMDAMLSHRPGHLKMPRPDAYGRAVLQMDQAALAQQEVSWHQRERGEDAGVVRHRNLRAHRHRQEGASLDASLYRCLQILSVSVFEKTEISRTLQTDALQIEMPDAANQLNLFEI